MKLDKLIEVLSGLQPVELQGVVLLRQHRSQDGTWFPAEVLKSEEVLSATMELMRYGDACLKIAKALETADPIPLAVPLAEYPL